MIDRKEKNNIEERKVGVLAREFGEREKVKVEI